MTILEKLLAGTLVLAIVMTSCVAISLTHINASATFTITFGRRLEVPVDPDVAFLTMALPAHVLAKR